MSSFFKNKKILVTGGAGFIGSHVVEMLVAQGALVTVPLRSKESKTDFLDAVKNNITLAYDDLNDMKHCLQFTKDKEIVMHLAARVGGVEYNIKHSGSIFRENVTIFMNILEASRLNKVERFLTVSSACVYPRFCTIPTPEEEGFKDTPEQTNEGYGWAKRMEEFLSQAYAKEYGMKIAIARPYNAYGPRDNFDPNSSHVIPALIKRVFDGENPLRVWGDGKQTRSFLYVEDFCRGLLLMIEKYPVADPINIGANDEISIKQLIELIVKISGKKIKVDFDTSKPQGQPRRNCDTRKAEKILGFKAQVSLEEGLKKTIEWYKKDLIDK